MNMHAAVVRSFDAPPRYESIGGPEAGAGTVVDVLAAGLHPRVRSDAAGRHYTSSGSLPMIPGIDGVGRLPGGQTVYFVAGDRWGSMAEQAVTGLDRSVPLPAGADAVTIAAGMNPAMSSWVALRRRVPLRSGQSVLILGATGTAGTMAVQVARLLGAGRIVGAGRDPDRLAALPAAGADAAVSLAGDPDAVARRLADAAADVDIVIDYLWGEPAGAAMLALLTARADRGRAMDWIEIGAVAGPELSLPSVALRSANLRLQGIGQGAVSAATYVAELPSLAERLSAGAITVSATPMPLASVEQAWSRLVSPGERVVLVP